jgi:hypothetical protein
LEALDDFFIDVCVVDDGDMGDHSYLCVFSLISYTTNSFLTFYTSSKVALTGVTVGLITVGLVRYFPHTIQFAVRRAQYYLSGSESDVDVQWRAGKVWEAATSLKSGEL